MRYEIIVNVNGEQQYLDTFEDVTVSLNFNIADINDITKTNSSYSKTVTLPDTKNNRDVFKYISSLTSISDFNPNKKSRCWVLKDTVIQLEGYIQLQNVIFDDDKNMDTYQCVIYGEQNKLFTNIGERYISQLNLERFDHKYNEFNMIKSWNSNYTNGYYYPLIDYGFPIDGSVLEAGVSIFYFYPGFYLKNIFDQIFIEAGYSYTSNFLNGPIFTKLGIPFNNKALLPEVDSITDNNNFLFSANPLTFTTGYPVSSAVIMSSFNCNVESYDPNSMYNTTNYTFKNNATYSYQTRFRIDLVLEQSVSRPFAPPPNDIYIIVKRSKDPITGASVPGWSNTPTFNQVFYNYPTGYPSIPFNGVDKYSIRTVGLATGGPIKLVHSTDYQFIGTIYTDWLIDYPLWPGEEVRFFFMNYAFSTFTDAPTMNLLKYTKISAEINRTAPCRDSTLLAVNCLPVNIKQKDLVSSVIKMFNLYIELDKEKANNFIIEPRDDYYNYYQDIKDWTLKLDTSKQLDIECLSNTQKRTNLFTYVKDIDLYNVNYSSDTNQIFGEYKNEIDNDFISDENKVELIFSPTPLDKMNNSDDIYVSNIYKYNNGNFTRDGSNIRLLWFEPKGLTQTVITVGTSSIIINDEMNLIGRTASYPQTKYPYAGYANDAKNPTYSLNFGQVGSFYNGYNETIHNLYYDYWQNNIEELTDKDGKLLTAYFNLSSNDISQFRFSDLILLKVRGSDSYYRVNRIIDYDPSLNTTTKVELIKAKDYIINTKPIFIPPPISVSGGTGPVGPSTGVYHRLAGPASGQLNLNSSTLVSNIGSINTGLYSSVLSTNNINIGDYNLLASRSSLLMGDYNQIYGVNNIVAASYSILTGKSNLMIGSSHSNYSDNSFIMGNNISVFSFGNTGSFFFGNNITSTENINGSFVIGSNLNPTMSNTTYIATDNLSINSNLITLSQNSTNNNIVKTDGFNISGITSSYTTKLVIEDNLTSVNSFQEIEFYSYLRVQNSTPSTISLFNFDCSSVFGNSPGSYLFEMCISATNDGTSSPTIYYNGKFISSVFYDGVNATRTKILTGSDDSYNIGASFSGIAGGDVRLISSYPTSSQVSLDIFDYSGVSIATTMRWNCKTKVTHMTSI